MRIRIISLIICAVLLGCMTVSCGTSDGTESRPSTQSRSNTSSVQQAGPSMPVRTPDAIGAMTLKKVFYSAKAADTVYCVDISQLSTSEIASLRSLQGLVAGQEGAAIYLVDGQGDTFWRDYMSVEYGVYFKETDLDGVFRQFADLIQGAVVYTPGSWEYAVALTMASLSNKVVVTPMVLEIISEFLPEQSEEDIRKRWNTADKAYEYVVGELLADCSPNYVAYVGEDSDFPDYIYATRALCIDPSLGEKKACSLLGGIVGEHEWQLPAVLFTEKALSADSLKRVSKLGFGELVVGGFNNATLFSSIQVASLNHKAQTAPSATTPGKICVSVVMDNPDMGAVQQHAAELWGNKKTLTRVSMQMSPALYELAPVIVYWFYQNSTNKDLLVSSSCGWSRVSASQMDEPTYELWQLTNSYFLDGCGLNTVIDSVADARQDVTLTEKYGTMSGLIVKQSLYDRLGGGDASSEGTSSSDRQSGSLACVGYIHLDRIEDLVGWFNGVEYDSERTDYYVVILNYEGSEEEILRQIDAAASNAQVERDKIFQFMLAEDLLASARLLRPSDSWSFYRQ